MTPPAVADPLPFIKEHPLPWIIEEGSPGVWIEDANNEVFLRFDPLFRTEAEALVASLNRLAMTPEEKESYDNGDFV
jgi:hypothetical protein